MVKELDRESKEILESRIEKFREEPISENLRGKPTIESDLDIEGRAEALNNTIDQYNNIIALAEEVETLVEDRAKSVEIKFDPDEDISLRDSIRRVFGIDTDIVTYDMYKQCLELREQLAEEDRQSLREQ